MRALLLVNPTATTVSARAQRVIARALATELDLEVAETRYRGHAMTLARHAVTRQHELVIALGGDGTVNETVNGILTCSPKAPTRPALAVVPGGNANVFARALGLPNDPVEATGALLEAIRGDRTRLIGLGRADDRYFTFCAGLGVDAEVIRAVEGLRASGRRSSPWLYVSTALRHFFAVTDRQQPALRMESVSAETRGGIFFGIVSNATPWTYLGRYPISPSPQASFASGLDLLALRGMGTLTTLNQIWQFLTTDGKAPHGSHTLALHDLAQLTLTSARPIAFQLDGDYLGERERVTFRSIPEALRVVVHPTDTTV